MARLSDEVDVFSFPCDETSTTMTPPRSRTTICSLLAVGLSAVLAACSNPGPTTTQIDFSERVHRDVVGEPNPTSPSIDFDYGFLEIQLTDTETVTLFGRNNFIEFEFIDPDKRPADEPSAFWTNEVGLIGARTSGHDPEETKTLLRERVELAGQTADYGSVDEWIDGKSTPGRFDALPRTFVVVNEWIAEGGWRLTISLLGRGPDSFTIGSSLSPTPAVATKDLTEAERISVTFNPYYNPTTDNE